VHQPVRRMTVGTQEVVFLKGGRIRVDLYDLERAQIASRVLSPGDTILFAGGSHGIAVLETATMVEVKNGSYIEGADKCQFQSDSGRA